MPLTVLDTAKAACAAKGGVCIKPGSNTTVQMEAKGPPRFARAASVAAAGKGAPKAETSKAWVIDIAAQLKKPAVSGNTLFVFYDLADPTSVKKNENIALFQSAVKAGKAVAVHLSLTGDDGFKAGHTYRMRIAQLLGGREVVLQETEFSLQ